ncbi:hypothetical protein NLJ89_g9025 [Agrocybe chaxingu]|uniref:Uncharacterized protein n=1 Tax=Agrocybe chaxingu TaxID=84603 RepID=A0A9W8MRL7_9AGAR|nr:hypothetical protein NLJ89_g9025 [Agrocybe chaxingu]
MQTPQGASTAPPFDNETVASRSSNHAFQTRIINIDPSGDIVAAKLSYNGKFLAVLVENRLLVFNSHGWRKMSSTNVGGSGHGTSQDIHWRPNSDDEIIVVGKDGTVACFEGASTGVNVLLCRLNYLMGSMNLTGHSQVRFSVVNEEGSELAAIRDRCLHVHGHPFDGVFSYASKTSLPPPGHPEVENYEASGLISLAYVNEHAVLVGFEVGVLVISTTAPYIITLRSILAPELHSKEITVSRTKQDFLALTRRGGYNFFEGDAHGLVVPARTNALTHTWVSGVTTAAGTSHQSFERAIFLGNTRDSIVLGASSGDLLLISPGKTQVLHLPGFVSVHRLETGNLNGKPTIIVALQDEIGSSAVAIVALYPDTDFQEVLLIDEEQRTQTTVRRQVGRTVLIEINYLRHSSDTSCSNTS